jgi:hypothetical protein
VMSATQELEESPTIGVLEVNAKALHLSFFFL